MLFDRNKNRDGSGQVDIRKLKQEIRAELARVHGGEPPPAEDDFEDRPREPAHDEPARGAPVAAHARRPRSVAASPLIQEAALGQMRSMAHAPASGGARNEDEASSPYGAFLHLVSRFETAATRLEQQVDRVFELTTRLAGDETRDAELHRPNVEEPRFRPDGPAVQVTLVAVPSFQGLMEIQRALSALPSMSDVTVLELDQGTAVLQLTLRAPVSLGEIMEGLRQTAGHGLLVEESRPEASRLRLRFIP